MTKIRRMKPSEMERLAEIDRTEHITQGYRLKDGALEVIDVDWHVERWRPGEGEKSVKAKLDEWAPIAADFENAWGAFDEGTLVGFVVYRRHLTRDMAQLAVLHVTRERRGEGIGKALTEAVFKQAAADGKKRIYVTATPSKRTVDFYMSLGFEPVDEPNAELYKREPEDIHMTLRL